MPGWVTPDQNWITLAEATGYIKADKVKTKGITGKNIPIIIVDTGVNKHLTLKDRVVWEQCFFTYPYPDDDTTPNDYNGHGTGCASAAAGKRWTSPEGKVLEGVAVDAVIFNCKVLNKNGSGNFSVIMMGMEAACEAASKYTAGYFVMSCSWGSSSHYPPMHELIARLQANYKVIIVFAAGNSGHYIGAFTDPKYCTTKYNSICCPGEDPNVDTVGTIAMINPAPDYISDFSSKGNPAETEPVKILPDRMTCGGSAKFIRNKNPKLEYIVLASGLFGTKASMGTSDACPQVSGGYALLVEKFPDADRETLKAKLDKSCRQIKGEQGTKNCESGWGVVDLEKALEEVVPPPPPVVVTIPCPHSDYEAKGANKDEALADLDKHYCSTHCVKPSFWECLKRIFSG